jgi:hypothetical protein
LLAAAALGGDPRAASALAEIHERGRGVPRDHVEALRWRRLAAERGDPESAYRVGLRFASGDGVDRDDVAARHWFRMAAERGHGPAQLALSKLLGAAGSSDADARESILWHARAVAAGAVGSPAAAAEPAPPPAGPTLSDLREARRLRQQGLNAGRVHAPLIGPPPLIFLRDPVSGLPVVTPGVLLLPGIAPVVVWPEGFPRRGW